ncbi:MAG: hypothetical protein ACRCXZ_03730 [Patescibacteria group bacterium]
MTKLFFRIGGLDRDVTVEDRIAFIKEVFAPFAELDDDNIRLIKDRDNGGFKNFCFVTIEDDALATKAIEGIDGTEDGESGYVFNLNVAQELDPNKPRDRGGRSNDRRPRY